MRARLEVRRVVAADGEGVCDKSGMVRGLTGPATMTGISGLIGPPGDDFSREEAWPATPCNPSQEGE